jgi:hypothetical protein
MLLGQNLILDFVYIPRKFFADPGVSFSENEEISTPPPSGWLIV